MNITVDHVNGRFRTHNFIIGIIVVYVMGTLLYVVTVSSFHWLDTSVLSDPVIITFVALF